MKNLFVLLVMLGLGAGGSSALAGTETHGGDGVVIEGKIYLLDLVEAGVELDPYLSKTPGFPEVTEILRDSLKGLEHVPVDLLSSKLSDVIRYDAGPGMAILRAFTLYHWILVNHSLVDVKDEDSVLDFNGLPLVQLAVRKSSNIRISRKHWASLDDTTKVALLLHEAAYSMAPQSQINRDLIGYIFSRSFANPSQTLWKSRVSFLPVSAPGLLQKISFRKWLVMSGLTIRFDFSDDSNKIHENQYSLENVEDIASPVDRVNLWFKIDDFVKKACQGGVAFWEAERKKKKNPNVSILSRFGFQGEQAGVFDQVELELNRFSPMTSRTSIEVRVPMARVGFNTLRDAPAHALPGDVFDLCVKAHLEPLKNALTDFMKENGPFIRIVEEK